MLNKFRIEKRESEELGLVKVHHEELVCGNCRYHLIAVWSAGRGLVSDQASDTSPRPADWILLYWTTGATESA
ncbi:hypothetical protein TNCV_2227321 [Trichonephila clavipes]|uniref:Uncharacterized protein n=1 Tax=Trichonephila clavipes TaxID=2585209 RepID=A0A8X6WEJ2_TRICX|nr:hypothetical protein TNCV_2227321 [Trichonephila clavipes]